MMKKILSLVLALALALSVTAVSLGEAAEAYQPEYADFGAHLNAFLSGLNAINQDIYLAGQANGSTARVLIGTNDDGVINVMIGADGQTVATLQADGEAAYVDYQGTKLALRLDTVQSFLNHLPDKLMSYAKAMGIDVNQIAADVQQLMPLLQEFAAKLMPAVNVTEEDGVVTATLNGPALGDALIGAINDLLKDETFAGIYSHYAPMFNGPALSDVAAALEANAESVKAVFATLEGQFVVNSADGTFSMVCKAGNEEMGLVSIDYNGTTENKDVDMKGVISVKAANQDMRIEVSESIKFGSFWLDYPTEVTLHEDMYQNGELVGKADMSYRADDLGVPQQIKYAITADGVDVDMEYENGVFTAKMNGQEMIYIGYVDGVLTFRAQGNEIVCREIENDADHVTYQIDVTSNGETRTAYAICQILENEGQEYLEFQVTADGEIGILAQLRQTEKQAFPLLKDDAQLNWITEEQLNSMLDNYVSMALSQLAGGR